MKNVKRSMDLAKQGRSLLLNINKTTKSLKKAFEGTCWKPRIEFSTNFPVFVVASETQEITFSLTLGILDFIEVKPSMLKLHQDEIRAILENWLEAEDE